MTFIVMKNNFQDLQFIKIYGIELLIFIQEVKYLVVLDGELDGLLDQKI